MDIIKYISVNLLLFFSWHVLLFRNKSLLSFSSRLLGVFVISLAQIIITEMVLGVILKQLYAMPLFALNISISLAVLVISVMNLPTGPENTLVAKMNKRLRIVLADVLKEISDKTLRFLNILKSDRIVLTIFILFFMKLCYLLFAGYLFPSYSWDALLYHLPTVGFILQSGAIEQLPYSSLIYTFINVFPKNIDLLFLWNVIFLKSDMIVDLSQLPFTIAGMIGVYGIGRGVGIKEKHALFSALLFFFAPVIILQSTANYVDISVTALFLIALNYLLDSNRRYVLMSHNSGALCLKYNFTLLLSGITTGLLLGSKGSGPLFVIALSILYFIIEGGSCFYSGNNPAAAEIKDPVKHKRVISRYALYFILPVFLLGSYWYINNWIFYGNPVYPFIVKLFGTTLFKGSFSEFLYAGPDILRELSPMKKTIYVWLERIEYYYYASDLSGLGPLWFILFIPSILLSITISIFKRKYNYLIIAIAITLIFLVYPNNWFTRYVIFIFALGCIAFGIVEQFFEKRRRILNYIALTIVFYTFLTANSPTITPQKMDEFIRLPVKERSLANLEARVLNITQQKNYGLWSWIRTNVSKDDTLAYTFTPEILAPLWNNTFSNNIIFIKEGTFRDFFSKLETNSVDYVVVLLRPRSIEHMWLARLKEMKDVPKWSPVSRKFKLQYYDTNYAVFRIT